MDAFLWFAIIGAFTFWVLIPVAREAQSAFGEQSA
jgi:hypothetical protein